MIFVDTNYFIRFLLGDIPIQSKKAKELFNKGSKGEIKLFTSPIVIFEIYWLFSSFYEKTKNEVIDILRNILSLNFIKINEREIILTAVGVYEKNNLDLEDCYNVVYSKSHNAEKFMTFDKKLNNLISNKELLKR